MRFHLMCHALIVLCCCAEDDEEVEVPIAEGVKPAVQSTPSAAATTVPAPVAAAKTKGKDAEAAASSKASPAADAKAAGTPVAASASPVVPVSTSAAPTAAKLEGDRLAIEKRRQRDVEDRSNSRLAADLLGDVALAGTLPVSALKEQLPSVSLARPEDVDEFATVVADRLASLRVRGGARGCIRAGRCFRDCLVSACLMSGENRANDGRYLNRL